MVKILRTWVEIMVEISLFHVAFYGAIIFSILGGILGLMGIWFHNFWKNDLSIKLILTDLVLAGTSIVVAVITKFLQ